MSINFNLMFKTKILKILIIILFLILLPSDTASAESQEIAGFPFEYNKDLWNARIDQAVTMNANWVFISMPRGRTEFDKIRSTGLDPHKSATLYAKSKGLKVTATSVLSWWGSGCTRDIACVDLFMQDFEWLLDAYRPDGFEAEEFASKGTTTDQLNSLFTRMRVIIDKKIAEGKLRADFQFGLSVASHDFATFYQTGIDINYLNNNHILDYIRPEMVVTTLPKMINLYNLWLGQFPKVDVRPTLYVTWTALKKACIANGYNGFNDKSCFNPSWLGQIEWAHQHNIGFFIYYINTYNTAYIDPTNSYPGSSVPIKIGNILSKKILPSPTYMITSAPTTINTPIPTLTSAPINKLILNPGWNQVSSPVQEGIDLATIEKSCTLVPLNNQKLWNWNAQTQSWANPQRIEPFKGYWINTANSCTVTLSGTPATFTSIQLYTGWNKISASGNLNDIKGTCGIVDNRVWNWDALNNSWTHPSTLQSDKGYWIRATGNCTID